MSEQLLKLNPETGYYEGTFTVKVEAEIFRRVLFNYVEEYHIDPTNLVAWQKAIHEVARTGKWMTHPRAQITPVQERREVVEPVSIASLVTLPEVEEEKQPEAKQQKAPPATSRLGEKDEQELWDKALKLPVDQWETLLTPLPDGPKQGKWPYYIRRHAERKSLEKLKEKMKPAIPERVEAIAEALNGTRIK